MKKLIFLMLSVFLYKPEAYAVQLRQNHTVKTELLKLSDFFVGLPQGKDEEIIEAPDPGTSKHYPYAWVKRLAQNFGVQWNAFHQRGIVISRSDVPKLSKDRAQVLVKSFIQKNDHQRLSRGDVDIIIDETYIAEDLSVGAGIEKLTWKSEDTFSATLSDGKKMSTISGSLSRVMYVPTLKHPMPPGSTISHADIEYMAVPSKKVIKTTFLKADQIVGRVVGSVSISPKSVINDRDVVDPLVIKRGDIVTMKVQTNSIIVTLKGTAQGNAVVGQPVKVLNTNSKKIIDGIAKDSQTVVVNMSGN